MPWNDYESRYYYQQYNTAVPMTVTVSNSLIVYPNPGTGLFSMRYPNEYYNMASVYDALGRIVYQRAVQSVGKDVLDLNGLRTGSYLIRLSGKAPSISAPLIIER
jgi:hypothetical protein